MCGILLPLQNLQYHWNHPNGSSLNIHPFSNQCSLDRPAFTLNLFILTSKVLLSLAFVNQFFGNSLILLPKYEPPKIPNSNIFFGVNSGLNIL